MERVSQISLLHVFPTVSPKERQNRVVTRKDSVQKWCAEAAPESKEEKIDKGIEDEKEKQLTAK